MAVEEPDSERSTAHRLEMKAAGSFRVSVHAHTQTATSCEELIFTANHLETVTIITDVCVHGQASARGLMRAVNGTAPGASY